MAKILRKDIFPEDLTEDVIRNTNEIVPKKYQRKPVKSLIKNPYRSIDETRDCVLALVYQTDYPMSRLEIARLIRRKKSPHLNRVIESLVDDGLLVRYIVKRPNGADMWLYESVR